MLEVRGSRNIGVSAFVGLGIVWTLREVRLVPLLTFHSLLSNKEIHTLSCPAFHFEVCHSLLVYLHSLSLIHGLNYSTLPIYNSHLNRPIIRSSHVFAFSPPLDSDPSHTAAHDLASLPPYWVPLSYLVEDIHCQSTAALSGSETSVLCAISVSCAHGETTIPAPQHRRLPRYSLRLSLH